MNKLCFVLILGLLYVIYNPQYMSNWFTPVTHVTLVVMLSAIIINNWLDKKD